MPVHASASSRLHALLTTLMAMPSGQPLRASWSQALGIPEGEVQFGEFGLPLVARLVERAEAEAARADEPWGLPLRPRHVEAWSQPVFARGGNLDNPTQNHLVPPEALDYLDFVANVLRKNEHHEALPQEDELADLLGQVDELADSILTSEELADDVKQALLRRLVQLRYTIQNVRFGGAEGVQEAIALLVGDLVLRADRVPRSVRERVFGLALTLFKAFSALAGVDASLTGIGNLAERLELPSGQPDE